MPTRAAPDLSLDDITVEGRIAGRTLAALIVATAVGVLVVSWDDLWRRCGEIAGDCVSRASGAVIVSALAIAGLVVGALLWRRVGRRPVDAYGSSRYVWALAGLFALGSILVASRIPAFTCERGRFDDLLELCMHPPSTSEPQGWLLAKQAIVAIGGIGAIVIGLRPPWIRVTAVAVAIVWLGGIGWVLADTMM